MSNLPVTTGGGAVVSLPGGSVIPAGDVGDMSVDRGAAPQPAGAPLVRDLQHAMGFGIGPTQIAKAHDVLKRHRLAEDQRQRTAAETAIHARWGAATEGNLVKIHGFLLDTMGKELADEILGARDSEGTGICNKPAVLEAMLKAAQATPAKRTRENDGGAPAPSAALSARRREIESWMGAPRGSALYKRYYDDPEVQSEYQNLVGQGVTNDTAHNIADSDVKHRIEEIESWMGARPGSADHKRYWNDPQIQEEYLQLRRRQ